MQHTVYFEVIANIDYLRHVVYTIINMRIDANMYNLLLVICLYTF